MSADSHPADSPVQGKPSAPSVELSAAAVPFVIAGIVMIGMVYGGIKWWQVRQFEATRGQLAPGEGVIAPLTEFELTERSGQPFRSTDMHGKVWVVSFFFASCPGPCLRLNGNIQGLNQLPDLKDVTWVSITCDPENDTLDVLKSYAQRWDAAPDRWLFCTADLEYLKRVARGMNLALFWKTHSDHAVVIDRTGKVRGMFDGTSTYECGRLRTLLDECLAEQPPAEKPPVDTEAETVATSPLALADIECCEDPVVQPAIRSEAR